jgi:type I restriction enzyme M protein
MSLSSFIWSVADLLRGDYKQSEYGKVILPFTVLRRMDCVLAETKEAVLAEYDARYRAGVNPEPFLLRKAKQSFYNTCLMDMKTLMGDQDHIKENLYSYMQEFSPSVRDIFERFDFFTQIDRLAKCGLLYQVAEKFTGIDLHPETVSNTEMGTVFEELIRKFAEISTCSSSRMTTFSPSLAWSAPSMTRLRAPAECSPSPASIWPSTTPRPGSPCTGRS